MTDRSARLREATRKADAAHKLALAARARDDFDGEWAAFMVILGCVRESIAAFLDERPTPMY